MREKLLLLVGLITLVFVLFLIRVFFGAPVLLIVIMLLVILLGIAYRKHPEYFQQFLARKSDNEAQPQTTPVTEPVPHVNENKTYLVLTSVHASSRNSIIVDKPCFVIGRNSGCDHVIDNREVSKRHLRIDYRETEKLCYATDLNSTNKTLLNGMRINGGDSRVLKQGDILQIANEVYQVEYAHF